MAFAIKRQPPPPINGPNVTNFHPFLPHFFLLQLNFTCMKWILHLVPAKMIILKSSYNWLKIDNY